MKCGSFKGPPQKRFYRFYRCQNFDIAVFGKTLKGDLESVNHRSYKSFKNVFLNVFNICGPLKTKMPRFKISIFVTKKLRKEMIKKSKLKNNFNKSRNHEGWCKFKTHRNYCVNLLRKSKK